MSSMLINYISVVTSIYKSPASEFCTFRLSLNILKVDILYERSSPKKMLHIGIYNKLASKPLIQTET